MIRMLRQPWNQIPSVSDIDVICWIFCFSFLFAWVEHPKSFVSSNKCISFRTEMKHLFVLQTSSCYTDIRNNGKQNLIKHHETHKTFKRAHLNFCKVIKFLWICFISNPFYSTDFARLISELLLEFIRCFSVS